MKPPPFLYLRPASLADAVAALAQHGDDAKPLAGGQSLLPISRPICRYRWRHRAEPDPGWRATDLDRRQDRPLAAIRMFPGAADLAAAPPGDHEAVRMAAQGMCLVGTPESVAAELGAYLDAGIDQIQFRPAPGGMPAELATRTIELAGQQMLPALSQGGENHERQA